jgi:hypothetical protein
MVLSHPMSTPINLNQFRKQKARAQKRVEADENSVKFGRTKAQKRLEASRAAKASQGLNAHKLDKPE